MVADVRQRFARHARERDLLRCGHRPEVVVDLERRREPGAARERRRFALQDLAERCPQDRARLEHLREIADVPAECRQPDANVGRELPRRVEPLGIRQVGLEERRVRRECGDVLRRPVVQVEREAPQAALRRGQLLPHPVARGRSEAPRRAERARRLLGVRASDRLAVRLDLRHQRETAVSDRDRAGRRVGQRLEPGFRHRRERAQAVQHHLDRARPGRRRDDRVQQRALEQGEAGLGRLHAGPCRGPGDELVRPRRGEPSLERQARRGGAADDRRGHARAGLVRAAVGEGVRVLREVLELDVVELRPRRLRLDEVGRERRRERDRRDAHPCRAHARDELADDRARPFAIAHRAASTRLPIASLR